MFSFDCLTRLTPHTHTYTTHICLIDSTTRLRTHTCNDNDRRLKATWAALVKEEAKIVEDRRAAHAAAA